MQEKLQQVLDTQKQLQERLGTSFDMTTEERAKFFKEQAYFVTDELHELGKELPHLKGWKSYDQLTDADLQQRFANAREEFIDVFTFLMNIALALDIDAEAMYKLYFDKNKVNNKRQDDGYEEVSQCK